MIRLVKVSKITDNPSTPDNFLNINTLSWFTNNIIKEPVEINIYEVTPYYLKNEQGHIFENIWQSSKIYKYVHSQQQRYGKSKWLIWEHPAEQHIDSEGNILLSYWNWRQKILNHKYAVRYPNGFNHRHECICCLWPNENGEWEQLDYINARKKIYCHEYARLVKMTTAYQRLKILHDSGYNLQFMDIDVPVTPTIYNDQLYNQYLHDTSIPFGHTWTLAACLNNLI